MDRSPKNMWVAWGITISLILPLVGSLIATLYFSSARITLLTIHSAIETAGGLMALAISGILIVERDRGRSTSHYLQMACGLICMGVLDTFHALVQPGEVFVWLHSAATFIGGAFFSIVWLDSQRVSAKRTRFLAWTILLMSLLFGSLSCSFPSFLPSMIRDGQFTNLARGLNISGGFGFLISGSFFASRFFSEKHQRDWLFAIHTMLFGFAGILFEFSSLWDLAWWWWHLLRFVAYLAALIYAIKAFLEAEKEALSLNRNLRAANEHLDETVAQRTAELSASEERFALAVNGSCDGIWDWDLRTDAVYYAPRFKELIGYQDHEMANLFSEFESRLHPEDHDRVLQAIHEHHQRRAPYDVEYRLQTKSGAYRWFRARGQAIWNESGQPVRMAGSITDIQTRKETEAALKNEQFLLQTLLNNLPDAIYFKDLNGRFLRVSSSMARHLGAEEPQEVLGKSDFDFFETTYAERARQEELEVMKTRVSLIGREEQPQWPDGTSTVVLSTKIPLLDPAGKILGTFGISHDVTALKNAEDRFRSVVEGMPAPILVSDPVGTIQLANKAAEDLFGYSAGEMTGIKVESLVPEEYRAPHIRHRQQFVKQLTARTMGSGRELLAQRRDGTRFPAELALQPVSTTEDVLILIGIYDLTAHKQAEEALRSAKESAEEANRAKSDFLANMSHEIRTPMNAVIGMSELVLDTELTSLQRDYLTIVLESAESLLVIINQILDFSKIESGVLELEQINFDLREEVGDTLKSLAFRAHSKGLELAWHVAPDVPTFIQGDPTRLRQILVNLVGNSIKFTGQGEIFVDVVVADNTSTDKVPLQFSVRDTGIGIPPDKVQMIFLPFQQADSSTTRQYGGTGLGLTIAGRIVEAMNGRIWVESVPDVGTKFFFTATFAPGVTPENMPPREFTALGQLPVLVVDDNALNRRLLKELLENWGMQVKTVAGGPEAIKQLEHLIDQDGQLPLLISDVNMPGMDGFELVQILRASPALRRLEIIMLTSGGRPGDMARCEELGVQSHLMKPVKQSELLNAVLEAVGQRRTASPPCTEIELPTLENFPTLNILLVEDGKANQRLARALLEKCGHTVTIANNGQEGIEFWKQNSFDLILMDVQMPVLDGFSATQQIRDQEKETGQHIPIIAMTARAMKGDREKCLAAGMDGYVPKPVRKATLYEAIEPFFAPVVQDKSELPSHPRSSLFIDWNHALKIVDGDEELLDEIVGESLQELPQLIAGIKTALNQENMTEAERFAHTLKSTGRTFGLTTLTEQATCVEQAAAATNIDEIHKRFPDLETLVQDTISALNQRRHGRS